MQPSPRAGRPHSGTAAAPRGRPGRGRQGRGTGTPGGRARAPGRGAGWVCVNLLQACEAGARDGQQETEKKPDKNTRKAAKKNRNVPKSKKNAKTHTHTKTAFVPPASVGRSPVKKELVVIFLGGSPNPVRLEVWKPSPPPRVDRQPASPTGGAARPAPGREEDAGRDGGDLRRPVGLGQPPQDAEDGRRHGGVRDAVHERGGRGPPSPMGTEPGTKWGVSKRYEPV